MPLNIRFFKKLVHIGPGKSVQDRIIKRKARNTSRYAFSVILSNPKKLMEGQFEKLEPDGHLVQVFPYLTVAKVSEIEDSLEAIDSSYDTNERKNSHLNNIPSISKFLPSADHCRINK